MSPGHQKTVELPSFEDLVRSYYQPLYAFGLSLARNADTAADLTQETFLMWARRGYQLRDASKARTWLFTTLYRHFLRQRQRSARFVATELDDVDPSALATPSLAEAHVDGGLVLECLQRLDETFRAPLTLFYLDQLSYREIAESLEVPIGTVMSRLARGKDQLRALLGKEESASRSKITPFTRPQPTRAAQP